MYIVNWMRFASLMACRTCERSRWNANQPDEVVCVADLNPLTEIKVLVDRGCNRINQE